MKAKLLSLLSIAVFFTACSNQDSNNPESLSTMRNNSECNIRSYEEALAIAQASIPMLENSSSLTRSVGTHRKIDLNDRKVFKLDAEAKTRTNSNINDTLIYVFNFEDNAGFALVSASKNTNGLLAITEQGYCDPDTPSEIEGFEMFKTMAKDYVLNASAPLRTPSGPIVETKDSITYSFSTVGPYVTVRWGQSHPEGEYCSNGICGCTNTAMAQIMSYYNYPSSIDLTYSGADVSTQNLDWTSMKAHSTGHTLSNCGTQDTHKAIGRFLRQLGKMNHSTYYTNPPSTSTSSTTYVKPTFETLGYTCGNWADYLSLIVRNQLNNAHLYVVIGRRLKEDNTTVGHCWMLDGYKTITITIQKMARTATSGWFFTGEVITENNYYLHFNWGWYGNCSGYFAEGVYDTSQALIYDTGTHNVSYNYNISNKFLNVYH